MGHPRFVITITVKPTTPSLSILTSETCEILKDNTDIQLFGNFTDGMIVN